MRKTFIIYLGICSVFSGLTYLFVAEAPVESADIGRVLGEYEALAPASSPKKLSLSDVLSAPDSDIAPVEAIEAEKEPSAPEKAVDCADISLAAASALAVDWDSGEVLYEKSADKIVPIASISKLMTALVFLDSDPDLDKQYQIKQSDYAGGGYQYVAVGDMLDLRSLLALSLVASANTAAQALVGASGLANEEFIALMNKKALVLGLTNTSFHDPVGLSQYNVSTAREVAIIIKKAMEVPEIKEALALDKYECLTAAGVKRSGRSTNKLLSRELPDGLDIIGGKTGYTQLAGNCFAGNFLINQEHGIITVILGATTENERFSESLTLAEWVKDTFRWQ